MIKIENKKFETIEYQEGVKMTYAQLINLGVGSVAVTQGCTFDQMEFVLNLKKTLDKANGTISLDKDQLDYIQKTLPTVQWKTINDEMIDFKNFILEAK